MCHRDKRPSARVRLREFERDWYRSALVKLADMLNELAGKYEDGPHSQAWLAAYEPLRRRELAEAAAAAGVLTNLFEEEE